MNESVKSISNESSNISWDSVISDFKSNVEASTQEIYEEYYDSTTKQPLHGGILTTLEKQLISKLDYIGKRVDNSDNLLCTHSYFPNMELYFHFIGDQTIPLSISSKHGREGSQKSIDQIQQLRNIFIDQYKYILSFAKIENVLLTKLGL